MSVRRCLFVLPLLILLLVALPSWGSSSTGRSDCTSTKFRKAAIKSYTPWNERRTQKAHLRALKRCAPNDKTRNQMISIERKLAHARAHSIRHFRKLTSCHRFGLSRSDCTAPDGTHFMLPFRTVNCESGGNDGVSYHWDSDARIFGLDGGGAYGIRQYWWSVYVRKIGHPEYANRLPSGWPHLIQGLVALAIYADNGSGGWACSFY